MLHKALQRQIHIEQHKLHLNPEWIQVLRKGKPFLLHMWYRGVKICHIFALWRLVWIPSVIGNVSRKNISGKWCRRINKYVSQNNLRSNNCGTTVLMSTIQRQTSTTNVIDLATAVTSIIDYIHHLALMMQFYSELFIRKSVVTLFVSQSVVTIFICMYG